MEISLTTFFYLILGCYIMLFVALAAGVFFSVRWLVRLLRENHFPLLSHAHKQA